LHDVVPFNFQMANYFNEMIFNSKKIIVHTEPCQNLLAGWKCPVCGRGLSPYTSVCPCVQSTIKFI